MRIWTALALLTACGGSPPAKPVTPDKPAPTTAKEETKPPEAPKEKPPVIHHAKAQMTPTKASKLSPFVVGFMQHEGDNALVLADLPEGVKPGTYHYVIHDGGECGPEATKMGAPWRETKDVDLKLIVNSDLTGALDNSELAAHLDGDLSIIGHTLALHDDKKGKPGKALACAPIEASED